MLRMPVKADFPGNSFPVEYTPSNAYLIQGEIPTLVDTGYSSSITEGVLEEQLQNFGYTTSDIKQIIYTHHHIDHSAGGVILSQSFQMKHLIHSSFSNKLRDYDKMHDTMRYVARETAKHYPGLSGYFTKTQVADRFINSHPSIGNIQGPIEGLRDGEIIDLRSRKLRVVWTPGHSLSDVVLVDEESGLLFSGDVLMKFGTYFAFVTGSDVGKYLKSLEKLEQIGSEIKLVLPGHGDPIQSDLPTVIAKSRYTIQKRSDQIVKYLQDNGQKNAIDIFEHLYSNLLNNSAWPDFFWTTVTHLRYLQENGQILETEGEPGTFMVSNTSAGTGVRIIQKTM